MKYTIVLENTVTKTHHFFNVDNMKNDDDVLWQFDIDTTGLDDGDYTLTLIEYGDGIELTEEEITTLLSQNDFIPLFIKNNNNTITNNDDSLIDGYISNGDIKVVYSDILRVGDYKTPSPVSYKNKKVIKQYNG